MIQQHAGREPIAIVGIGCRLPGAIGSPRQFWEFLLRRGDAIGEVPEDRWNADALFAADPAAKGRTYARRGGFLRDIDQFDAEFFSISPREAAHVDPQQRLLLETAHEAMENAGERWDAAAVRNTGVFVGLFIHDYQHIQFAERESLGPHTGTGTAMSIAANRISYVFDLRGPSIAVDTACSSSLVAVDLACKALWNGECEYALAGGANVILRPEMTIAMSKATMLSPDGYCRSFDAKANGYVRGEGAALVVLRRLSTALAAGNRIYATILGSGVNSDGQTKGISVPNGDAQELLTRSVLEQAGVPAHTVGYVEAHGTGTPVGDPIEAGALGRVFSSGRSAGDVCLLGSVKSNIGHLESASGVAGLIKAALCLYHREIPPNLHFEQPNPAIDFEALRLRVVRDRQPWPVNGTPRRAAVNSFGFGGTNAHVLLEQAPEATVEVAASDSPPARRLILPLGAHDAPALRALAGSYAKALEEGANVRDLLYTVSQRRSHGRCRAGLVARDAEELRQQLVAFAGGNLPAGASFGERNEAFAGKPVFVFSGMGSQWWGMGRELLHDQPVFRSAVERVDALIRRLTGWSVIERLLANEADSRLRETDVAQPALFAIQCGLIALLADFGVEPIATIGHSVGEAAALYAAGILTLEDAATVIYHRSRLQRTTAGSGGMLAAGIDPGAAAGLIRGLEDNVSIAAINSPRSLTLSGDMQRLLELRAQLEAHGKFARLLDVEVPYHSAKMDAIRQELIDSLGGIQPHPARIAYYSTADAGRAQGTLGDAAYWWRNVRMPVEFAAAMAAATRDGHACFLEIGPHPVLAPSMLECLKQHPAPTSVVASLRRKRSDFDMVAAALGELHVAGATIAWERVLAPGRLLSLEPYPFQRSRHWAESHQAERSRKGLSTASSLQTSGRRHPLLGDRLELPAPSWIGALRLDDHPYLADHKVQGAVVFPGTGYLEMALQTLGEADAGAERALQNGECLVLGEVEIGRALYLTPHGETRVETRRTNDRWEVQGYTEQDGSWVRHASGKCRREKPTAKPQPIDLEAIRARCPNALPADYAYRLFRDVGLEYGPAFQAIEELSYGAREALSRLTLPPVLADGGAVREPGFLFHPALLDACLHTLFGALNLNGDDSHRRGNVFLPVAVRKLCLYRRPTTTLWSHARLHARESRHFEADISIYDADGALVADVFDLRCQALEHPASVAEKRRREWLLEYAWSAAEAPPTQPSMNGRWLVLAPTPDHEVVASLRDAGAACVVAVPGAAFACAGGVYSVAPEARADFEQLLSSVANAGAPLSGVVHAFCLGAERDELGAARAPQLTGAGSLLHLVQALALLGDAGPSDSGARSDEPPKLPRLWVLTDRTQPVSPSDPIQLPHSTVWGLRRVIANEHPALSARIADLDGTAASYAALAGVLGARANEDEIALRGGVRFVHRLRRYLPDTTPLATSDRVNPGPVELEIAKIGDLNSAGWVRLPALELGAHDVEIDVEAAGLNFKDVMKATGLFSPRLLAGNLWSRETLGMECAGRIIRVGAAVRGLLPGDRVMALAPRSFASRTITHAALVMKNPGLSPAAAAGLPVAFLTAAMGLEELAGLAPGERVLIHAASGGVGQAAIQIAHDIGAEVFATAGSDEKRQLVRELGVEHVFDSRSLAFAEAIRDATRGEGVDVVLNSLAGEAIAHGVALLRDYGRFIEIGKMDLDRDLALGLRPFIRCLSFHALDLDRLLAQRVETCARVLQRIQARLAEGRLRPLPVTSYRAGDVADAFHAMAAARHTGKLVVDLAAAEVSLRATTGTAFRADASYLVTGGLGGFGFQLARFLAARGAGRLLLLGRRGPATPGADQARNELEALGAEVQVEACDVADAETLRQVLARVPAEKPLRGVFHAAAVLDDALLKNLDLDRYERTFLPKAVGAWNLHVQTLSHPLDHFMCFSSMASVLGNQGSANYCAANAFVDSLAHYRRRGGRPALTVNWGVIADVGMAADEDFYRQNLERNGLKTIHSAHCLELLDLLMQLGRAQTTVCPIDFDTWLRFNPAGRDGRLSELLVEASQKGETARSRSSEETALRETLDAVEPAARVAVAQRAVQSVLARVFRTEPDKIDTRRSLTALGADSLMAIEIKNRLEALGLAMSVTQLLNRNSVTTLASGLLDTLGYADSAPQVCPREETVRTEASSWLLRRAPRAAARIRLVCFPYAGGGPAVYHQWPEALPDWVEVIAVNLPDRGARAGDGRLESITQAADAIVPELLPLLDRPFALFGHCMGAIIMYEVAARLNHQHGKVAAHVFASGCMAPHLYNSPIVHEQDDAAFLDVLRLISFSGTRALIEDPELRAATFPMLRADFRAVAEYGDRFEARPPLDSPITGLAADNDLFAAPKAMEAWATYTSRGYDLAELSGDHYFVESDRDRVVSIVAARLTALDAALPAIVGVAWRKPDNAALGRAPDQPQTGENDDDGRFASNGRGRLRRGGSVDPTRVFCFPPTGFHARELPLPTSDHDLVYEPVEWRRGRSAPTRSVAEMVSVAYAAIRERLAGRVIFYGHCLGAVVAYELALLLQREGLAAPEHLLTAGTVGPHLYVAPDAQKLPDQKLLELLGVLKYPFADRLNEDASFRRERLAMIRADLEAMATYQYREGALLTAPITAISLRHDLWSYPLRTSTWRHHTEARFDLVEWDGDHYHSLRHPERIRALVRSFAIPSDGRLGAHQPGEEHELCT